MKFSMPNTSIARATIKIIVRLNTSMKVRFGPLMRLVISTRLRWSIRRVAAAIPMKTPQAKNPVVTSCSQRIGSPNVRVTTSTNTEKVNPAMETPQSTIRTCSSGSSACHFRWRWRAITSDGLAKNSPQCQRQHSYGWWRIGSTDRTQATIGSFYVANELENLHGVRTELLGKLVLNRLGIGHEARLVDVFDNLDAHRLEFRGRIRLQLESERR